MDEMTQQNAALVEQAAASAQSMHEQSKSLAEAVEVFKLDVATTCEHTQALSASAPGQAMSKKPTAMQIEFKSRGTQIDSTAAVGSGGAWERF